MFRTSGAGVEWQPVRRPWLAFAFLPRSPDRELLFCRANSNKLLYARLPAAEGQREAVFHFGSHPGPPPALALPQLPDSSGFPEAANRSSCIWSLVSGVRMLSCRCIPVRFTV